MNNKEEIHSKSIIDYATSLGFDEVGISTVQPLYAERKKLEQWLSKGYNGTMSYMERYIDQRTDPTLLVPNAKSVITLLLNYYPSQQQKNTSLKISKYAYGKDYHFVIKEKLLALLAFINKTIGEVNGRGFVDSAPVFERAWAAKSGLGWVGKNGNLIVKKSGSFFFIANLIIDLPLYAAPKALTEHCGTCTKCIDACPTQAILPNKVINATKCISYYTIELKAVLKNKLDNINLDNWMFGCDVCQDVCPWNKFAKPHNEEEFLPYKEVINFEIKDWLNLDESTFKKLFKQSPLSRGKHSGLTKNIEKILKL